MSELTSMITKSIETVRLNLTFNDNMKKAVTLKEGNIYRLKYINFTTNVIKEFVGKLITIAEVTMNGFIMTRSGKTYNLLFDPEEDGVDGNSIWITTVQLKDIDVVKESSIGDGNISDELIREAVNDYLAENPIEDGAVPVFQVGEVKTLATGSEATVSITGTPANPVLNLGIPRGATGATGAAGKDGANGKDGADGEDGVTPKISIGTIETLAAGSQATATISGSIDNLKLNLGIPKGATGATGTNGKDGSNGTNGKDGVTPSISIGTVETLEAGSSASATISGTIDNLKLNLKIPKGATGAAGADGTNGKDGAAGKDGADGDDGITPNITIGTIETLAAGSQATATITGTTASPVLNLGIPKGAAGTNGKDGAAGKDGSNGNDGYTPVRGTDYWTDADIAAMQAFCTAYIDEKLAEINGE